MTTPAQLIAGDRFSNTEALTGPVDEAAVAQLRESASAADHRYFVRERASVIGSIVAASVLIVAIFGALVIAPPFLASAVRNLTPGTIALSLVCTAVAVLLIMTVVRLRLNAIRSRLLALGSWTRRWRMATFAAANGMGYDPRPTKLPPIGSVLSAGKPIYSDAFWFGGDRGSILGNAATKSTNVSSHAPDGWFFAMFKLDASVPHMLLIPQRRKLTAVGYSMFSLAGTQRLRLEGDWDRHFALYVPNDYERDALYVITPDLMALLIDNLPGAYIETWDDNIAITAPGPLDFADPDTWPRINRLIDAVLPKTLRQTRNYRDERSEVAGEIAPKGRVLRAGLPIASAISALAIITQILLLALR